MYGLAPICVHGGKSSVCGSVRENVVCSFNSRSEAIYCLPQNSRFKWSAGPVLTCLVSEGVSILIAEEGRMEEPEFGEVASLGSADTAIPVFEHLLSSANKATRPGPVPSS